MDEVRSVVRTDEETNEEMKKEMSENLKNGEMGEERIKMNIVGWNSKRGETKRFISFCNSPIQLSHIRPSTTLSFSIFFPTTIPLPPDIDIDSNSFPISDSVGRFDPSSDRQRSISDPIDSLNFDVFGRTPIPS
ncbi:hypothetical protein BLNAU_8226 [Blattamonas nauphoetae]|uniref:Uncharacterized protein n=1 Tax=Blattamonas nauphoetae TaxID=2049346 RepID=A0ABQ9XZ84_9EUKA|nr:hypothetical protein BLNAU_8226 [Blattamonas nauphoetae]